MFTCLGGSSSCTCQERLPWHAEKPDGTKQLARRIFTSWFITYYIYTYNIYIYIYMYIYIYIYIYIYMYCCFRFDTYPKEALYKPSLWYFVILFVCMVAIVFKVNTANIQYFWVFLDIQINYSWKSVIILPKHCTLHKTYFALQYWSPYFFHGYSYQEYHLFFRFVGS